MRIGINGFGRIGRLVFRQLVTRTDLPSDWQLVQINDPGMDAGAAAYLATFDSVHGRLAVDLDAEDDDLLVHSGARRGRVPFTSGRDLASAGWAEDLDVLLECSGKFKSHGAIQPYLDHGIGHVIVSAPVGDAEIPNVVVGVNDHVFDPERQRAVSGASCTTNCVAPVVSVLDEVFGIARGSIDTVHAVTPSQKVMDGPASDLRRGRAGFSSLIPTTTGAAKALGRIFPHLEGHISGLAIRVPVTCPSITDCTFELKQATDAAAVNAALTEAAEGRLEGILGVETRPLVSIDYVGDWRSSIVDAPSTLVVDGHHLKVLAWYDNETGYSHRLVDLLKRLSD